MIFLIEVPLSSSPRKSKKVWHRLLVWIQHRTACRSRLCPVTPLGDVIGDNKPSHVVNFDMFIHANPSSLVMELGDQTTRLPPEKRGGVVGRCQFLCEGKPYETNRAITSGRKSTKLVLQTLEVFIYCRSHDPLKHVNTFLFFSLSSCCVVLRGLSEFQPDTHRLNVNK